MKNTENINIQMDRPKFKWENLGGYGRGALMVGFLALMSLACTETASVAQAPLEPQYLPPQALIDAAIQLEMHPIMGTVECSGTTTGVVADAVEHCVSHIMNSNWVDPDGNKSKGVILKHDGSREVLQTEPQFCSVIDEELNEDNPALCYLKVVGSYPSWFRVLPDSYLGSDTPVQVGESTVNLSYPQGVFGEKMEIETAVVQWIGEADLPHTDIRQEEICTEKPGYNDESGSMLYRRSTGEIVAIVNSICNNPDVGINNFKGSRRLPSKSEINVWRSNNQSRYMNDYASR